MLLRRTLLHAATPSSRFRPAISIIEVMIFIVCLSIAVIGASAFRYFSTLDIRKSDIEMTAARTTLLLCDTWRGAGGLATYNPLNDTGLGLNITNASEDLAAPAPLNFTTLGSYCVVVNDYTNSVTLSYFDVDSHLRVLNVHAEWPASEQPANERTCPNKSFSLSALVSR